MVQISIIAGMLAMASSAVLAAPNLSIRQTLPDPAGEKNIGNGQGIQFIGGQCLGAADCASGCCAIFPRGGETIGVCSGVGAQTQAGKQGCGFEAAGSGGNNNQGNNQGNSGNGRGGRNRKGKNRNGNNGNNGNDGNNNVNNGNNNGNTNGDNTGNGNGSNNNDNTNNGNTNTGIQPSTLQPDPAGAKNVGNGQSIQFIGGECTSDADCASTCCALVNTGAARFGICSGLGANTQNGKQGCGFPAGGQRIAGSG